jgi:porphyrinogen peroxidase
VQAQEGVLKAPYQYSLIQKYIFDDLPLIAMNVARIGAQTPGMAYEVADGEPHLVTIGFGPMNWLLITPDIPAPGGFRAFDEIDVGDEEVPESEGDMLLYFSSGYPKLNRELANHVKELFGRDGVLIEDVEVEGGEHSNVSEVKEQVLINHRNYLDQAQSSFLSTHRFLTQDKTSTELPQHRYNYKLDSESGDYVLTFDNNPSKLEEHSESLTQPAATRGLFFIPSLDLLTSLRMGGIRMGSLAINAKWKQ